MLPEFLKSFLLVSLVLFACGNLSASESSTDPTAAEQLKQLNDQTIIGNRISLGSDWSHFKDGAEKATWTLAGLWGWPISDRQDWGVRFKLPFAYHRSDAGSDHAEVIGVGDAEIGTGPAFRLNDTWRTGGGIELHADTASDRALAESVWRLKQGWGVSHDVTKWLTLTVNADYDHSIVEKYDVRPQSYLELSLPVTLILPDRWSINARYRAAVDFENGDRWGYTVGAGVAKRLSKLPIALSASVEKPLGSGKRFQASITIVYYFERYQLSK
jgi:long-subunit fatty acid transport protein